ncbi:MAG TPA: hypothetical protein VF344_01545 [Candidatus Limnocylindrales bacterium]
MSERRLGRPAYLAALTAVVAVIAATAAGFAGTRTHEPLVGLAHMGALVATPSPEPTAVPPVVGDSSPQPSAGLTPEIGPTPDAGAASPTAPPSMTGGPKSTPATTAGPTPPPATPAPPAPTQPPSGWKTVVNDRFDSGGVPSHWAAYDGPYGSGPGNCAIPSHAVVSGGYLHLLMSYETSNSLPCGPGWYTGGFGLRGYSSVDQRVTVRFRVVNNGVASHFIIPMRWPDDDSRWPAAGEEDFCETDTVSGCTTFLHYTAANRQYAHSYSVDLSQWHTLRFQRLNHVVAAFIDNMNTPVWTFSGNATTLPDTLKHVVLQQECHSSCPSGTTGSEDIQIDWITVENPG